MEFSDKDIGNLEDRNDSNVYETNPESPEEIDDSNFSENLAESMSESSLKKLANYLLEAIDEDINARREWLDAIEKSKSYLGFTLEDLKEGVSPEFTRTFDTTLSTALIRFVSTARAELLPQAGPAGFKIKNDQFNEMLEKEGEHRRDVINNFLTVDDKGYYPDFEKFLLYLGLCGSIFRKIYYDNFTNMPISRFILPEDFIVNGDCTSILESTRITHVLHLTKREIILNQQNGIYRDVDLKYLKKTGADIDEDEENTIKVKNGIDLTAYSKRSMFPIYEVHTYIDLEQFSDLSSMDDEDRIPLPYVIAVDKISKEILYIRKNWDKDDEKRKAINYFIQYNYIPGFGIYGLGLAHLLGSNAISSTIILRQLIDAGKFKNLPGGLRVKGFGQQNTDILIAPGEWPEIDTGGLPLDQGLMPLPYSEPSQTLRELWLDLREQNKELGSTSEMGLMDSREDIPAATALMAYEVNNRIPSGILRSIYSSLAQELQRFDEFLNSDTERSNEIEIIPISDPSLNSTIQRITRSDAIVASAMQAPDLHNMPEVFNLRYQAYGLDQRDIDKILIRPSESENEILPVDPISEYINILLGKPVKAAIWQNHPAHILCLGMASKRPEIQDKPEAMAALQALMTEHQAFQYLIEMQQLIGIELPPLEQLQDPEIQNNIAMALADALNSSGMIEQSEQPAVPDPNAVWLAEVQAKEAEIASRERIANVKAETDIFKAQLDFEKEKAKIESNEDIAQLKSETELAKNDGTNGSL